MTCEEFLHCLDRVTQSPRGTVTGNEDLLDIPGWDSMPAIEFQILIEKKVGRELDGMAIEKCRTVKDLLHLMGDLVDPA